VSKRATPSKGKELPIQFAHITEKAMRDHWGPIVNRIADEIEKEKRKCQDQ
jgi:hypothetical protein